ncbi:peptidoglycan-binding protein [Mesorhizobium sp. M0644]|uniref:peptidoglycan-binding domain-containing protein n=1 Tax=unclassified Mesorhizobium TaxID=325217 RepID=UPI0033355F7D
MGNELGRIDGNIGPQTRRAIGIWQAKNGLPADHLSAARATCIPRGSDRSDDGSRACRIYCRSSPYDAAEKAGCAEGPHPAAGGAETPQTTAGRSETALPQDRGAAGRSSAAPG